jgi:hypothetical protein
MTGQTNWTMFAVVVVAFIAGYAIVSFVVGKLREGAGPASPRDQTGENSTSEDRFTPKSETRDAYPRGSQDTEI